MKYQESHTGGHTLKYSSAWITELENHAHFDLYYQQAKCVYEHCKREQKILEIGVGSGLLSDLLKKRGWDITTLDIDKEKNPDICANAIEFEYHGSNYNVILAFEVFEHLPYALFEQMIAQISAGKIDFIYFSVPWNKRRILNARLSFPKNKNLQFNIFKTVGKIKTPAHHWELSKHGKDLGSKKLVELKELEETLQANGYRVSRLKKESYIEFFKAERIAQDTEEKTR